MVSQETSKLLPIGRVLVDSILEVFAELLEELLEAVLFLSHLLHQLHHLLHQFLLDNLEDLVLLEHLPGAGLRCYRRL